MNSAKSATGEVPAAAPAPAAAAAASLSKDGDEAMEPAPLPIHANHSQQQQQQQQITIPSVQILTCYETPDQDVHEVKLFLLQGGYAFTEVDLTFLPDYHEELIKRFPSNNGGNPKSEDGVKINNNNDQGLSFPSVLMPSADGGMLFSKQRLLAASDDFDNAWLQLCVQFADEQPPTNNDNQYPFHLLNNNNNSSLNNNNAKAPEPALLSSIIQEKDGEEEIWFSADASQSSDGGSRNLSSPASQSQDLIQGQHLIRGHHHRAANKVNNNTAAMATSNNDDNDGSIHSWVDPLGLGNAVNENQGRHQKNDNDDGEDDSSLMFLPLQKNDEDGDEPLLATGSTASNNSNNNNNNNNMKARMATPPTPSSTSRSEAPSPLFWFPTSEVNQGATTTPTASDKQPQLQAQQRDSYDQYHMASAHETYLEYQESLLAAAPAYLMTPDQEEEDGQSVASASAATPTALFAPSNPGNYNNKEEDALGDMIDTMDLHPSDMSIVSTTSSTVLDVAYATAKKPPPPSPSQLQQQQPPPNLVAEDPIREHRNSEQNHNNNSNKNTTSHIVTPPSAPRTLEEPTRPRKRNSSMSKQGSSSTTASFHSHVSTTSNTSGGSLSMARSVILPNGSDMNTSQLVQLFLKLLPHSQSQQKGLCFRGQQALDTWSMIFWAQQRQQNHGADNSMNSWLMTHSHHSHNSAAANEMVAFGQRLIAQGILYNHTPHVEEFSMSVLSLYALKDPNILNSFVCWKNYSAARRGNFSEEESQSVGPDEGAMDVLVKLSRKMDMICERHYAVDSHDFSDDHGGDPDGMLLFKEYEVACCQLQEVRMPDERTDDASDCVCFNLNLMNLITRHAMLLASQHKAANQDPRTAICFDLWPTNLHDLHQHFLINIGYNVGGQWVHPALLQAKIFNSAVEVPHATPSFPSRKAPSNLNEEKKGNPDKTEKKQPKKRSIWARLFSSCTHSAANAVVTSPDMEGRDDGRVDGSASASTGLTTRPSSVTEVSTGGISNSDGIGFGFTKRVIFRDPRLLMAMTFGSVSSPRAETVYPHAIGKALETAAKTYIRDHVKVLPPQSARTELEKVKYGDADVILPALIAWYRYDFAGVNSQADAHSILTGDFLSHHLSMPQLRATGRYRDEREGPLKVVFEASDSFDWTPGVGNHSYHDEQLPPDDLQSQASGSVYTTPDRAERDFGRTDVENQGCEGGVMPRGPAIALGDPMSFASTPLRDNTASAQSTEIVADKPKNLFRQETGCSALSSNPSLDYSLPTSPSLDYSLLPTENRRTTSQGEPSVRFTRHSRQDQSTKLEEVPTLRSHQQHGRYETPEVQRIRQHQLNFYEQNLANPSMGPNFYVAYPSGANIDDGGDDARSTVSEITAVTTATFPSAPQRRLDY